jgi:hypothetical protein
VSACMRVLGVRASSAMARSCSDEKASLLSTTKVAGVKRGLGAVPEPPMAASASVFASAASADARVAQRRGAARVGVGARSGRARRATRSAQRMRPPSSTEAARARRIGVLEVSPSRRRDAPTHRPRPSPPSPGMDLASLVPRLSGGAPLSGVTMSSVAPLPLGLPPHAIDSCAAARQKAPSLTFLSPQKADGAVWEQGIEYTLSLRVEGEAVEGVSFSLFDPKIYSSWRVARAPAVSVLVVAASIVVCGWGGVGCGWRAAREGCGAGTCGSVASHVASRARMPHAHTHTHAHAQLHGIALATMHTCPCAPLHATRPARLPPTPPRCADTRPLLRLQVERDADCEGGAGC